MPRLYLLFALLALSPLFAITEPCPGGFGVSGEWLYMLPSIDQPEFVIDSSSSSSPIGRRVANEQSWHSGYRLESIYSFCNGENDVRIRWTHFPGFSESKTVTGSNLFGILNHPASAFNGQSGTASIDDEFHFFFLDALFGQRIVCDSRFSLLLQAGFQTGFLRLKEKVNYLGNSSSLRLKIRSKTWGIGPEVGLEGKYNLWRCLNFTGRFQGALLVSERNARYQDELNGSSLIADVKNEAYWNLIPTSDLKFGFSREWPCNCFNFDLEVGYEILTYYDGIQRIFFVDNSNTGSSFNENMTFTLQGPYVHAGIAF